WLLTGYCHLRGARRTFAMHRVLDLRRLDPDAGGPDFDHPADFDARQVARVQPWQYEVHDPLEVVLEVDEEFAWHAASVIGCTPDDAGRTRLMTSNVDALVELARAYGPRIRIVSPPDLRRRVVDEMKRAGRRHWDPASAPGPRERPAAGRSGTGAHPGPSRRDDSTSRLRRFMFIISYLSRHPEAEVRRLCSILEVDERTLLSDLERLSLCGVYPSTDFQLFDISVDHGSGRVRFRRNPVPGLERPVRLTRREVVALLLGFKLVRDVIAPPFDWAADQVMEEIMSAADRDLIGAVEEMEKRVSLASRHELSWDTFYEVSMGVCRRSRLEIEYYTKSRDAIGRRVVRPYVLVCTLGRWYLVGFCEWRREVRTFRMDRIRRAGLVDGTFDLPDDFDPRTHLGGGIYASSNPREDERVVVAFDPAFIEEFEGREAMEFLEGRRGDEITFAVHPDRYEGFVSWLLSFTARFSVVHPAPLAECVERRRRRVIAAHGAP
ncbi:MAG: WYL domain-containing protein, partial [Deltaproteobacteria bacterium]|nr:WYL domain-containing protein [Deltaproteobacteria bacterium]